MNQTDAINADVRRVVAEKMARVRARHNESAPGTCRNHGGRPADLIGSPAVRGGSEMGGKQVASPHGLASGVIPDPGPFSIAAPFVCDVDATGEDVTASGAATRSMWAVPVCIAIAAVIYLALWMAGK